MNKEIYNCNYDALKNKYPKLIQAIEDGLSERETIAIGVADVEARKVLYAIHNEKQYQLDSLYDAEPLLEIWRQNLGELSYQTNFVMFGLGNGMYVKKLLATTEKEVQIIVFEPVLSIIAAAIEEFDLSEVFLSPRVHIVVPGYTQALDKTVFQFLTYENKSALQLGTYLNYNILFEKEAEEYVHTLQLAMNSINSTQNVLERFGEAYFHNSLANMPYLVRGRTLEQLYYALPKDVPAVIVAAGPSLDKNVSELKKAKNRAFIIAVDTAARALLKQDVIPDLFITVDGKKLASHFTDERLRKIPVVCCLQGNKDALGVHTGLKFFFDDENAYVRQFFKRKKREFAGLSTGGSVANDAFSLADTLRFQTIILVGQDLAYTNHQSHALGTVAGETGGDISDRDTVEMEGYYGEKVLSSPEFQLYRKWFEDIIAEKSYLHVINATEGGANIRGAENMPLKKAIESNCKKEVDFEKLISKIPPFFNQQEQKDFWTYLKSSIETLTDLAKRVQEGLQDYDRMELLTAQNTFTSKSMKSLLEKNGRLTKELDESPVMCFVQYRIQKISTEMLNQALEPAENGQQEMLQAIRQGKSYLKNVEQAMEEVIPVLRYYFIETKPEKLIEKNQTMAEIQGLLGQMQLNAQKAMRCYDE